MGGTEPTKAILDAWLQQLMPGPYSPPHIARMAHMLTVVRLSVMDITRVGISEQYPQADGYESAREVHRRSKMDLGLQTVVTMPSEIHGLCRVLDWEKISQWGIYDLWAGTGTIAKVFRQYGVHIRSCDANPAAPAEQRDALDIETYRELAAREEGIGAIVSSPDFRFVDLALALAVKAARIVTCFHVPGDYLSNGHPARITYFLELKAQGRVAMAQNLPKGPTGRSNQWLIVFGPAVRHKDYLLPVMYSEQEGGHDKHRIMMYPPPDNPVLAEPSHNCKQGTQLEMTTLEDSDESVRLGLEDSDWRTRSDSKNE